MRHPMRTAAISLQDQAAMDTRLTNAAQLAHILATAAETGDTPVPRVRGWLHTADLTTPRALLVRHGTPASYDHAHDAALAEAAEGDMWDYTPDPKDLY